jgi:DegV family protein with EDD domain
VGVLCQVAAESPSLEEAVRRVEERVPRQRILALLDTLRYLEMGGRITRAQAMIGTVLDVKPIMGVAEGRITPLDRVRTRRKALVRLGQLFDQDLPVERVAVMHAQAPEEAAQLRARLTDSLGPEARIEMSQIGTVLATHTGPRALGIAYIKEK